MALEKKPLEIPTPLKDFLQNVDVKELSQDLFTSQGICAFISFETKGIFLIGSSERFISDAEKKLQSVLTIQALHYKDKEVVKLKKWSDLMANLLDLYNTSIKTKSGVEVSVRKANMCKLNVDAVMNAANEDLKHIGGLALALLNTAGHEMQQDCDDFIKQKGKVPPGQTFVTKSYRLPCKHVIHAVGPKYTENGAKLSHLLLKLVVTNSLTEAEKLQCASVAMPAVSSGIFGFPVDLCAETIAQVVREFCDDPKNQLVALRQVQLVDNNDKTVKALAEAVKREFSDLKPTTRVQTEGAVG
uniref:Macro domain-containing protein n=1 Tax=Periophthalmus magnuspinnatus TaxID=409849 RepID=A0A3B4BIA3_9GOBI